MGYITDAGRIIVNSGRAVQQSIQQSVEHAELLEESRAIRRNAVERRRTHGQRTDAIQTLVELSEARQEVAELKKELEKERKNLQKEQERSAVIRDVATEIIITRSAMHKTLEFLKKKWVAPDKQQEFEADAAQQKAIEIESIENNESRIKRSYEIVDNVSNDWIAFPQKNVRRKDSSAKPKSPK